MSKKICLTGVAFFAALLIKAQCVMCRAVAESGATLEDGSNIGEGLNTGILYLMAIPYLLLVTLVWVFFKHRIKAFFLKG